MSPDTPRSTTPASKPVRADAAELAYDELSRMIAAGDLRPGERLREQALADRIGVSRTPVREALGQLAAQGIVELSPNRGAQVVLFSEEDMNALFDLRVQLEPHAVLLAVPRLSAEDLESMKEMCAQMEETSDLQRLSVLNNSFHEMFFSRAGSRNLTATLRSAIRPAVVTQTFSRYSPHALARSMRHHAEILEAASVGDGEWASTVMRAHILAARHVLSSTWDTAATT